MHEQCGPPQQFRDRAADAGRGRGDRIECTLRRIGGHCRHLEYLHAPALVGEHEVGERAADVDADAPATQGIVHARAFARALRGRGPGAASAAGRTAWKWRTGCTCALISFAAAITA